ncbi:hypothetical protein G7046_g441 [Stylonectria norvegica]|nr:hypothetical protein G7046_g441 [Stylonectria norvegica]
MEAFRTFKADLSRRWELRGYDRLISPQGSPNPNFEDKNTPGVRSILRWLHKISTRRLVLLVVLLAFPFLLTVSALKGLYYNSLPESVGGSHTYSSTTPESEAGDRRLVVLLPAQGPGPDLCKVIVTATAMGYPSPVIVNWGKTFAKMTTWFGGRHLGKIVGSLEYLSLEYRNIVVLVDTYDVWFQLPPEVLLQRYHEANRAADARLAAAWSGSAADMPMKQTIIVSSQKKCYPPPDSGSVLHCDSLPESTMPKDLYGPDTDILMEDQESPWKFHNIRPRYLNSGSIMGPVGDMRRYFQRVKARMDRSQANGTSLYSDQGVFGEVFGEQEIWRQWRRERHASWAAELPQDEGTAMVRESFEFHVGLDYTQQLFIPTVFEEDDGNIVTISNETVIAKHSAKMGISPVRLVDVPDDIKKTQNPLRLVFPEAEPQLLDWRNMPLYADFFTTAIPAVIHHNAHKDDRKWRRVWWWDRTWFFPYLRQLLALHLTPGPLQPLARINVTDGEVVYWALKSDETKRRTRLFRPGNTTTGLDEASFESLCRFADMTAHPDFHWYDEVFRDGLGPIY